MPPIRFFSLKPQFIHPVALTAVFLALSGVSPPGQPANHAPPHAGLLPVTGGKLWYRGRGGDKVQPALIALHGGPGASHLCFEFFDALADERPVVIYDQLGCGQSDHPDNLSLWTMERAVEELDQVIQGL